MISYYVRRITLFALFLASLPAGAQRKDVNYDEAKVPRYSLPDPLVTASGERVTSAKMWTATRRPEILRLFQTEVYGRSPARPSHMRFELASTDKAALGGRAVRKQVIISFNSKPGSPRMNMLLYLPAHAAKPSPVILGLNFGGNQTVHKDPGIRLGYVWTRQREKRMAEESSRGAGAESWQVEKILAAGFGLATIYYGDIEPDFDGGMKYGVRSLYAPPAADEWGAIGAWAWGLSRALDYLETDRDVDAKRVVVFGHSRLGKTTLWAAAQDQRFALAISNDSGEGGAALARRQFGERVHHLNSSFPHWFCANYRKYNQREDAMPVDQHMLLALVAPRPLYVASAEQDQWADPKGEFLSAVAAGPVYALFGKQGLGTDQMPGIHQPIMNTVAYHIRAGKHAVTAYDWEQYLTFATRHLRQ